MKVRKKFMYEGIELRIVDREETYLNSPEPLTMTRVLAPNGGTIPVQIPRRSTLKNIVDNTIDVLENFKSRGFDVHAELTESIKTK